MCVDPGDSFLNKLFWRYALQILFVILEASRTHFISKKLNRTLMKRHTMPYLSHIHVFQIVVNDVVVVQDHVFVP
jgi:hypothetical protein